MRAGIEDVLAQYPNQWNIENFTFFACLANDAEMTKALLSQMDGEPIIRAWKRADILESGRCTTGAPVSKETEQR